MYIISRSIDFDSTLNSIFYVHCSTSTFAKFRQFSNENVISVDQILSELQVLLNKTDSLQYDLQFLGFLVTVARIIVAICISVIQSTAHRSTADFSRKSYNFLCISRHHDHTIGTLRHSEAQIVTFDRKYLVDIDSSNG